MLPLVAAGAMGAGALIGGIGSYMSSESQKDALKQQLNYLNSLSPQLKSQYQDQINQITSALNSRVDASGGNETIEQYRQMVEGYDPNQYSYSPTDFAYTSGVNDFQDPAAQYRMKAAQDARQSSLAGQGNLFGGGAQRQLEAEAQELASKEWANSYERMQSDKTSAYQMYRDKVSDIRNQLARKETGYMNKLGLVGQQKQDIYGAQDLATNRQLDALNQYQQSTMNLGSSIAGVNTQRNGINSMANAFGGAMGGITAGANIYGAFNK